MCSQFGQPKYNNVGTDASPRDQWLGYAVNTSFTTFNNSAIDNVISGLVT